ncbi:MAG: hypothetical protein KIS62_13795 [Ramlibacter sp.]|nr:hypothetical protein [Ramlibacter sp.]MBX3659452.1 hypothetical protein [Ramlibacter sp.]MCW5650814.1 hypothetical protein [Ramlibacter sp.]
MARLSATSRALAQQEAQGILDDVAGVTAVVVATVDGFDVASVVRNSLDASRVAALASSICAIGDVVSAEARLGRNRSITVDTDDGMAVIHAVHRPDVGLVINVVARADAIIAQVNYRTAAAARALAAA